MRSSSGQRSQNRTIYALLKPTKKHDIATWLDFFRSRVILCCVSIKYRTSYFQTRFQICQFSPKRVLKIFLIDSWIATIRENVQKRQKRFKFTNRNPEKLCQPVKELRARYCTHNARARAGQRFIHLKILLYSSDSSETYPDLTTLNIFFWFIYLQSVTVEFSLKCKKCSKLWNFLSQFCDFCTAKAAK